MNNYSKMLGSYTKATLDALKRTTIQDAHQSETKSIECLKQLVVYSAEVFNLWKLLSEHQFYIIASKLNEVSTNQKKVIYLAVYFFFLKLVIFMLIIIFLI